MKYAKWPPCDAQQWRPALVRARNQLIIQSHVANWSEVRGTLTQPFHSTRFNIPPVG